MLTTCRLSLGPGCGQHAAEQHPGRQLPLPFPAQALPRGRNRGLEGAERSGWAGLPQGSRRAEASRAEAGAEGASGHLDVSDENTPQRGSGGRSPPGRCAPAGPDPSPSSSFSPTAPGSPGNLPTCIPGTPASDTGGALDTGHEYSHLLERTVPPLRISIKRCTGVHLCSRDLGKQQSTAKRCTSVSAVS